MLTEGPQFETLLLYGSLSYYFDFAEFMTGSTSSHADITKFVAFEIFVINKCTMTT
jgi:hypothetical protein